MLFRSNDTATTEIYTPLHTLSLHDALPISVCALIDDAQKDQLEHLQDKDGAHTVWQSAELPPMPVVAFPSAPAAERETFKKNLDSVCDDEGKSACAEVGIDDLTGADSSEYAAIVRAYGK